MSFTFWKRRMLSEQKNEVKEYGKQRALLIHCYKDYMACVWDTQKITDFGGKITSIRGIFQDITILKMKNWLL